MSELHDRLERLAARGTRRGVDDVLQAARRRVPSEIAAAPGGDDADLEIFDDEVPFVTPDAARRRGRFGTLIAATGAAALVGVGALAVTALFGSGGAGSPEAAVRQLADAVEHKDPLAAVDVLEPTEVRSMRETIKHVTRRAADLKIVDDASQPLAGVDLSVDHLELSAVDVADGYAKVTIASGTLSASTHRAAMSKLLQDAMRNAGTDSPKGSVDLARLASSSNIPTFVMTVRHDGRWYVSPAYTALEYAREIAGGPAADFGSAKAADLGADTPEHAVTDALHAWQAGDWNHLIALAPPDELPVYDYRAWLNQEGADKHPEFTIDTLSTSASIDGDTAIVKLDASGTTGSGSNRGRWQVGGTCPAADTWPGYSQSYSSSSSSSSGEVSTSGGSELCLAGDLGQAVPFGLMTVGANPGPATQGPISIEVVREGGRWFVSPVSTVLDAVNSFVDHVDERSLYPLIGLGYLLPPDATITLNQPFTVPPGSGYGRVYAFEGTAGQDVVGEIESASVPGGFATAQLYTADGRDAGFVDFAAKSAGFCCATGVTLPATGSYRLVVLEALPSDATLTLFDADHAPKSLLNNGVSSAGGTDGCTRTLFAESCTKSGSVTYPTTAPTQSVTRSTTASACRRENDVVVCRGPAVSSGVATTSVP